MMPPASVMKDTAHLMPLIIARRFESRMSSGSASLISVTGLRWKSAPALLISTRTVPRRSKVAFTTRLHGSLCRRSPCTTRAWPVRRIPRTRRCLSTRR